MVLTQKLDHTFSRRPAATCDCPWILIQTDSKQETSFTIAAGGIALFQAFARVTENNHAAYPFPIFPYVPKERRQWLDGGDAPLLEVTETGVSVVVHPRNERTDEDGPQGQVNHPEKLHHFTVQ
jgi:hypothetical protein